ncbi:MAG TPA: hypothetical protein VFV56_10820 [Gaiellaceae bacterium]|jgi:hypothetical protein|nr:hypothetical protein [Gaiellaceae bacterium]
MRILAFATALVVALLAGASVGTAAEIGANDDSAKFSDDGGAALYGRMVGLGLRQTVIGVRFVPSDAMVIQDKPQLDRAIEGATGAGLNVILAVYPYPPREIEAGLGSPSLFASYVGVLASVYPQVRKFVIGNEPNQPAFWRPQFDPAGNNVSAQAFGPYLAAAYDTLKGVDPSITVVGVGLSPRGNDRPTARNNISTSPVRFLRSLGAWYRRSGRTKPLMDEFSFHPYPNEATDPLERGYQWPNAGFANLDRLKQALWDAFNGTAQPTTAAGLKLDLDEVGWQVDTTGLLGYRGRENVAVTDEITQAAIYGQMIREAACDPDIASLSFFGFRDDGLRTGFQAGLERADGTERAAALAVQTAIPEGCAELVRAWTPGASVLGTKVAVGGRGVTVLARLAAGEDARAKVCVSPASSWLVGTSGRCRSVGVQGLRTQSVDVRAPKGTTGLVQVSVQFAAESNRARRTFVVRQTVLRR